MGGFDFFPHLDGIEEWNIHQVSLFILLGAQKEAVDSMHTICCLLFCALLWMIFIAIIVYDE